MSKKRPFSEVLEDYLEWREGEQAAIDASPGYTPKRYYQEGQELREELDSYFPNEDDDL